MGWMGANNPLEFRELTVDGERVRIASLAKLQGIRELGKSDIFI